MGFFFMSISNESRLPAAPLRLLYSLVSFKSKPSDEFGEFNEEVMLCRLLAVALMHCIVESKGIDFNSSDTIAKSDDISLRSEVNSEIFIIAGFSSLANLLSFSVVSLRFAVMSLNRLTEAAIAGSPTIRFTDVKIESILGII